MGQELGGGPLPWGLPLPPCLAQREGTSHPAPSHRALLTLAQPCCTLGLWRGRSRDGAPRCSPPARCPGGFPPAPCLPQPCVTGWGQAREAPGGEAAAPALAMTFGVTLSESLPGLGTACASHPEQGHFRAHPRETANTSIVAQLPEQPTWNLKKKIISFSSPLSATRRRALSSAVCLGISCPGLCCFGGRQALSWVPARSLDRARLGAAARVFARGRWCRVRAEPGPFQDPARGAGKWSCAETSDAPLALQVCSRYPRTPG